jgi:nucleoside-diphosphate-sugar epimerase
MPAYGRLLVTGAAGFVGRHLLALLRARYPAAELIAACTGWFRLTCLPRRTARR